MGQFLEFPNGRQYTIKSSLYPEIMFIWHFYWSPPVSYYPIGTALYQICVNLQRHLPRGFVEGSIPLPSVYEFGLTLNVQVYPRNVQQEVDALQSLAPHRKHQGGRARVVMLVNVQVWEVQEILKNKLLLFHMFFRIVLWFVPLPTGIKLRLSQRKWLYMRIYLITDQSLFLRDIFRLWYSDFNYC